MGTPCRNKSDPSALATTPQVAPRVDRRMEHTNPARIPMTRKEVIKTFLLNSSVISPLNSSTGDGRAGGIRTPNPRIWSPLLYQFELLPCLNATATPLNFFKSFSKTYSVMSVTTPAPTVFPPSRIANRSSFSIAMGAISSTFSSTRSPGITISVPSFRVTTPVMSVVRK